MEWSISKLLLNWGKESKILSQMSLKVLRLRHKNPQIPVKDQEHRNNWDRLKQSVVPSPNYK